MKVWEPACGSGKIMAALSGMFQVYGTDATDGIDFLRQTECGHDAIITNPPYNMAEDFIRHAVQLTEADGFVAMLLRTDYDHAKTRRNLFESPFAKKLVLTKRIRWIEGSTGSPSFNHAWFIWDWKHSGPPQLAYH